MKCSFGMRLRVGRFVKRKQPPFNSEITRRKWVELNKLFEIRPFGFAIVCYPRASRSPIKPISNGSFSNVLMGLFHQPPFFIRK